MKSVKEFWCYKVLPLIYDSSLSYYEAVSKVASKTNEIIKWIGETEIVIADIISGLHSLVTSVNSKTGDVVLDAADVGALPATYTPPVVSVNSKTGAVIINASDVGALPDNYTPPVTSVNTKTGAVELSASDVGALPSTYTPPVTSVNGQTGDVVISGSGAVDSVNGMTGDVVISIPTKTSDLTNDSGFIEEDDVIVHPSFSSSDTTTTLRTYAYNNQGVFYSWHLYGASSYSPTNDSNAYWQFTLYAQDTPSINYFILTAVDLNNGKFYICDKYDAWHEIAMASSIPTKTSDLSNDSGFVNASGAANAAPVQSVNGSTGAVTLAIPTKTSDLVNDSGFVTGVHVHSASDITSGVLSTSVGGTGIAGGLKGDSGVLYGTTEPANPATGQVFFKVAT